MLESNCFTPSLFSTCNSHSRLRTLLGGAVQANDTGRIIRMNIQGTAFHAGYHWSLSIFFILKKEIFLNLSSLLYGLGVCKILNYIVYRLTKVIYILLSDSLIALCT